MAFFSNHKFFQRFKKALIFELSSLQQSVSYAQCGEDLIVDFIARGLKLRPLTYLDIGTNHPRMINNTYFFYRKGYRGVCLEPDPRLCKRIKQYRPRDTVLNAGIGIDARPHAEFHLMTESSLNTFSNSEAERFVKFAHQKVEAVVHIPLLKINDVMRDHFRTCPDFVSIDTEGWDLDILRTLDFKKYRPVIFCIETLTYDENKEERKLHDIIGLMLDKNYIVYADTYRTFAFELKSQVKSLSMG